MKGLSPEAGRIVALALLVAIVALPWRLVVEPLRQSYAEIEDAEQSRQDMLARYERLADSREELRAELARQQEQPSSQEGYLSGESETLVAAELQNLVRTIVERNGGRLESTQVLPATNEGAFRRVSLRVRMAADSEQLFHIVYDLESMLPYVFLDSLDIVSRDRRGTRQSGGRDSGVLSVSYDVYGYMRSG